MNATNSILEERGLRAASKEFGISSQDPFGDQAEEEPEPAHPSSTKFPMVDVEGERGATQTLCMLGTGTIPKGKKKKEEAKSVIRSALDKFLQSGADLPEGWERAMEGVEREKALQDLVESTVMFKEARRKNFYFSTKTASKARTRTNFFISVSTSSICHSAESTIYLLHY